MPQLFGHRDVATRTGLAPVYFSVTGRRLDYFGFRVSKNGLPSVALAKDGAPRGNCTHTFWLEASNAHLLNTSGAKNNNAFDNAQDTQPFQVEWLQGSDLHGGFQGMSLA